MIFVFCSLWEAGVGEPNQLNKEVMENLQEKYAEQNIELLKSFGYTDDEATTIVRGTPMEALDVLNKIR